MQGQHILPDTSIASKYRFPVGSIALNASVKAACSASTTARTGSHVSEPLSPRPCE